MTQIDYAKQGRLSPEMELCANYENVSSEYIRQGLIEGTIIIPKNRNRDFSRVRAIGKGLKTKVNANIGTSREGSSVEMEIQKLKICQQFGADSLMDLSTSADCRSVLQRILQESELMLGTVPLYVVMADLIEQDKGLRDLRAEMLFDEIERQAEAGVDFMTVHCSINRLSLEFYKQAERSLGIVSRGGSLIKQWMLVQEQENPLYQDFDKLLDIASKHDVCLSLGDGMRPGGQPDASDSAQIAELMVSAELVKRAKNRNVQVMVEGPGHVPLHQVEMNIQLQKALCQGAPFYVLGPLVTDIAPGYDHISGAIGGGIAAAAGADFLCYLTPAEHLCLPDCEDVKQGVMASRIAAHAADIAKGIPGALEQDIKITQARNNFDWESLYELSLDPELARKRKESQGNIEDKHCSMCGKLCALKTDQGEND